MSRLARSRTRATTGALLIGGGTVFLGGALLYTARTFWSWPATNAYIFWERGFVMAGVLICVGGFALLELLLRESSSVIVPRLAFVTLFAGAVVLLSAEADNMVGRGLDTSQTTLFVVLAFTAEIGFGIALITARIVSTWVGWTTIAWNAAAAAALLVLSPRNLYVPFVHFVAPLIIGIALLARAPSSAPEGGRESETALSRPSARSR